MTTQIVRLGPEYFPLSTSGRPVAGGSIYIGEVDLDPAIPGNQKTVTALQENGSKVAIQQPIELSAGGFPTYNGSKVSLFVEGNYSLKVLDSFGSQDSYVPDNTIGLGEETGEVKIFATVAEMINETLNVGNSYLTQGYYAAGDGGGADYLIVTIADFDGTPDGYIDHLVNGGTHVAKLQYGDELNIRQAGARSGLANDNTEIIQAIHDIFPDSGGGINIPRVISADPFSDDGTFFCFSELVLTKAITFSGVDYSSSVLAYTGIGIFITVSVYGIVLKNIAITGVDGAGGETYNPGSTGIKSEGVIHTHGSRIAKFEYGLEWNGGFYHHFNDTQFDRCRIIFNGWNANNITIIGGRMYHFETAISCNGGVGPVVCTGTAFEDIATNIILATDGASFMVTLTGCYFENYPETLTLLGIGGDTDYYDSAEGIVNGGGKVNLYGNLINTKGFTRIVNHSGESISDIVSLGNSLYVYNISPDDTLTYVFYLGTTSSLMGNDFSTGTPPAAALYTNKRPESGFASDPILATPIAYFASDVDWITPGALLNGWTNDGGVGMADFGYYKDDVGRVYLRGRIDGGSSTSITVFTLPAGYIPPYHHYQASIIVTGVLATVRVTAQGDVNVELPATPDNVSLDGISFKV